MKRLMLSAVLAVLASGVHATISADERALLQRVYELRIAFENERTRRDNEARANVHLPTRARERRSAVDGLRFDAHRSLTRFEQRLRCLDLEVNATGGNTVVICGDNTGDISGSNTAAGRDLVLDP